MPPHDGLFRVTFSKPVHAAELLRSLLSPELCGHVDWSTLREVSGGKIGKVLEERRIDLVLSAHIAGRETWIMFLVEHQSRPVRRMALRVLDYMVALWRCLPPAEALPPIVPIVVHHGPDGWTAPRSMRELMALDPLVEAALGEHVVRFTLVIDDLVRVTPESIAAREASAQARLVLAMLRDARRAASVATLIESWAELFRAALAEDPELDAVLLVFRYISQVREEPLDDVIDAAHAIGPDAEETVMTLYERILAEGEAKGIAKGKAEGKAEGIAKGKAEVLVRQLALRFGSIEPTLVERVYAASADEVDAMVDRILTAATPADVVGG